MYKEQILFYNPPIKDIGIDYSSRFSNNILELFENFAGFEDRYDFADFIDVYGCSTLYYNEKNNHFEINYFKICNQMGYFDINIQKLIYSVLLNDKSKNRISDMLITSIFMIYQSCYDQFATDNPVITHNREYLKLVSESERILNKFIPNVNKIIEKNKVLESDTTYETEKYSEDIKDKTFGDDLDFEGVNNEKNLSIDDKGNHMDEEGNLDIKQNNDIDIKEENEDIYLNGFKKYYQVILPENTSDFNIYHFKIWYLYLTQELLVNKSLPDNFKINAIWPDIINFDSITFEKLDFICIINKIFKLKGDNSNKLIDRLEQQLNDYFSTSSEEIITNMKKNLESYWYKPAGLKVTESNFNNNKNAIINESDTIFNSVNHSVYYSTRVLNEDQNLNEFGLAFHLEKQPLFAQLKNESQLKKEVERVLLTNKITFKKNIVDYPFLYDFIVEVNGQEIVINVLGVYHEIIGFRNGLIYEERVKREYIKKTGRKYLEVSYSNFKADAFPLEDFIVSNLNSMIEKF